MISGSASPTSLVPTACRKSVDVDGCDRRLEAIFGPATPDLPLFRRRETAQIVHAALSLGAIEGSAVWIHGDIYSAYGTRLPAAPTQARVDEDVPAIAVRPNKLRLDAEATLRNVLRPIGAVIAGVDVAADRQGFQLTDHFARLFRANLSQTAFLSAVVGFREWVRERRGVDIGGEKP